MISLPPTAGSFESPMGFLHFPTWGVCFSFALKYTPPLFFIISKITCIYCCVVSLLWDLGSEYPVFLWAQLCILQGLYTCHTVLGTYSSKSKCWNWPGGTAWWYKWGSVSECPHVSWLGTACYLPTYHGNLEKNSKMEELI